MATNMEMIQYQREKLFDLLWLKKVMKGRDVKELDILIARAVAAMSKEDSAYVEKQIAELSE